MQDYQPMSGLGWIDFSDTDKQNVMKVLQMLQEGGTVDELGIGSIRNALSQAMFSGITTIMTRAKYYFIVPRILQNYLNSPKKYGSIKDFLEEQESEIMHKLAADNNYEKSIGIIGNTVAMANMYIKNKKLYRKLLRKPSEIYWSGIRAYGLYRGDQSLNNFLNSIDNKVEPIAVGYHAEDENGDDWDASLEEIKFFDIPYHKDWEKELSIELTLTEAEFLKNKIIDTFPNSLLGRVLENTEYSSQFLKAKNFEELSYKPFLTELPEDIQVTIQTARDFWMIIKGAHIRFNILLQKKNPNGSEFMEKLNINWQEWVEEIKRFDSAHFDINQLWKIVEQYSYIKPYTKKFINEWVATIQHESGNTSLLDRLTENQERVNKRSLSKLQPSHDIFYGEWVGINNLNFRFPVTQRIVRDIINPYLPNAKF